MGFGMVTDYDRRAAVKQNFDWESLEGDLSILAKDAETAVRSTQEMAPARLARDLSNIVMRLYSIGYDLGLNTGTLHAVAKEFERIPELARAWEAGKYISLLRTVKELEGQGRDDQADRVRRKAEAEFFVMSPAAQRDAIAEAKKAGLV